MWYSTNTVSYQDLPCTLHCSGYNLHEVGGWMDGWVGGWMGSAPCCGISNPRVLIWASAHRFLDVSALLCDRGRDGTRRSAGTSATFRARCRVRFRSHVGYWDQVFLSRGDSVQFDVKKASTGGVGASHDSRCGWGKLGGDSACMLGRTMLARTMRAARGSSMSSLSPACGAGRTCQSRQLPHVNRTRPKHGIECSYCESWQWDWRWRLLV